MNEGEEVLGKLFQAADDEESYVLERIAIKAGLRKKCPNCGWVCFLEAKKCESCGTELKEEARG